MFLRTTEGCRPARYDGETVHVSVCPEVEATCTWSHEVADVWSPSWSLSCERADGSGWGAGGGGSLHSPPRIVRQDAEAIEWAHAAPLLARGERESLVERPCTEDSAEAGTRWGSGPGRRCLTVTGFAVHPALHLGRRGMGVGFDPTPVDCREPCPANPDGDRVVAASAWLAGRVFMAADAPRIGLYRTEQACRDADSQTRLSLDLSACDSDP
jgi:hypothetical protein